tara:strand:- start:663 stop:1010 length:348 start_codon:yes stop_codon:yes gene_type:complete
MSVTASLPIESRTKLRKALVTFFTKSKPNVKPIVLLIKEFNKKHNLVEAKSFCTYLIKQGKDYHSAINSGLASAVAAKKYNIDQYAVGYFKRIIRADTVTGERNSRNNVTESAAS